MIPLHESMNTYPEKVDRAKNNTSSEDHEAFDGLAESYFIEVLKVIDKQLRSRRKRQKENEERIYLKWKRPVDLMEGLIDFCIFIGEKKKKELSKKGVFNKKHATLVKLHARSILISNEIVTLVRGGYADGAHARWRSLYEL